MIRWQNVAGGHPRLDDDRWWSSSGGARMQADYVDRVHAAGMTVPGVRYILGATRSWMCS
jgi:hypothetical protein